MEILEFGWQRGSGKEECGFGVYDNTFCFLLSVFFSTCGTKSNISCNSVFSCSNNRQEKLVSTVLHIFSLLYAFFSRDTHSAQAPSPYGVQQYDKWVFVKRNGSERYPPAYASETPHQENDATHLAAKSNTPNITNRCHCPNSTANNSIYYG
jgi:hypothetical protein